MPDVWHQVRQFVGQIAFLQLHIVAVEHKFWVGRMHGFDQIDRLYRRRQEIPRGVIAVQWLNQDRDPVRCDLFAGVSQIGDKRLTGI